MYRHVAESWQSILKKKTGDISRRIIAWRREEAVTRMERPSRIDRARRLGYKAKQGCVVVRVRLGRGGMRRKRPSSGRRPKHLGVTRMRANVKPVDTAQRRAAGKFPNLKPIGAYPVYKDGMYAWYEVVMIDPSHPRISGDRDLSARA